MATTRDEKYRITLEVKSDLIGMLKEIGPTALKNARQADRELSKLRRGFLLLGRTIRATLTGIVRGFRFLGRALRSLLLPGIGQIALIVSGLAGIGLVVRDFQEFGIGMSEVATIAGATTEELKGLEQAVLDLSGQFGTRPAEGARGLYQTISAGFTDAAEAAQFFTVASGLAFAGVATQAEAVNVLSNILNAYGKSADEAGRVSDVLFTTVRLGKTTLSELASGLSTAIPFARQFGVEIEELGAFVATLTATGAGTTSEVSTQLAAFLRALAQKFTEVQKAARAVGREFDENTVRNIGLLETLKLVNQAAGGTSTGLFKLLGRAEAVNAVLNVTNQKVMPTFVDNLEQVRDAAGSTGDAIDLRLANPAVRAQIVFNALRIQFQEMGRAIIEAASDAVIMAGGLDVLKERAALAAGVMGTIAGGFVRSIGRGLEQLNVFIEELGGIDRVAKTAGLAADVVARSIEVAFVGVMAGIQQAGVALIAFARLSRSVASQLTSPLQADRQDIREQILELRREGQSLQASLRDAEDRFDFADISVFTQGIADNLTLLKSATEALADAPEGLNVALDKMAEVLKAVEKGTAGPTFDAVNGLRAAIEALENELTGPTLSDRMISVGSEVAEQILRGMAFGFRQAEAVLEMFRPMTHAMVEAGGRLGAEIAKELVFQMAFGIRRDAEEIKKTVFELSEDVKRLGRSFGEQITGQLGAAIARTRDTSEAWRDMLQSMGEEFATFTVRSGFKDLLGGTTVGDFFGLSEIATLQEQGAEALAAGGAAAALSVEEGGATGGASLAAGGASAASQITTAALALQAAVGAGSVETAGAVRSVFGAIIGAITGVPPSTAANGAVWPGGFQAFAGGSPRVDRPTLGLIGEGRLPEAVVPLPDGRRIPVQMSGGGGVTYITNNYIDAIDTRSFEQALQGSSRALGRIQDRHLRGSRRSQRQVQATAGRR